MITDRLNNIYSEIKEYALNAKSYLLYSKNAFNIFLKRVKMNYSLISFERIYEFVTGINLPINIRHESLGDYEKISATDELAYGLEYEGVLYKHLKNTKNFDPDLSLIAEKDGKVLGHVLFYPVEIHSNQKENKTALLVVASVIPEYQNRYIGTRLIAEGIHVLKTKGYNSVIVVGYPEYYKRFGFEPASKWNIQTTQKIPEDNLLAMEFKPGALSNSCINLKFPG